MHLIELAMVLLVLSMVSALGAAIAQRSRSEAGRVIGVLVLWLALTAALARGGWLADWAALPPRIPLLPLTVFTAALLWSLTGPARQVIALTPRWWPIAAQSFRVGVELVLWALYAAGRAPVQITFEGRNFDVLVGLSAPLVAWLVARGRLAPKLVLGWNVLGLLVLANTVATVLSSTPGRLHRDWPGAPFTELAGFPMVWLPAFLAPLAVFLHLVSFRQTLAALRGAASSPPVSSAA